LHAGAAPREARVLELVAGAREAERVTGPSAPVAIVTGASSGIGAASARALGSAGFRVVLAARRLERLEALAKEIAAAGGAALPVAADLAREADCEALVARMLRELGRVDVLVNNAGASPGAPVELLPRAEMSRTFEVNLIAALHLTGLVTPAMRAQGGGRVINIGSLAGSVPAPIAVSYAATKAGMETASRCLRLELAPFGIAVSHVVCGFVDTETFENTKRSVEHIRRDASSPYRQLLLDLDEFAQRQVARALRPEAVARVVVRAATARRPRETYFAPASAGVQRALLNALPERWLQALLRRLYKIRPAQRRA
jgi:NAD(P)-dependent dehydrogenase (short-subunit alcohol dehydrogenase family)